MDRREETGSETSGAVELADGTAVPFRGRSTPATPGRSRGCTPAAARGPIELRFLGPLRELSDAKAARLARAEDGDLLALAAMDPDRPGEIVAVVRFEREGGGEAAEYAALVEDGWQGLGLGSALTGRLVGAARGRGIGHLRALVAPGNERMLRLLGGLGLPTRKGREGGAECLEVDLRGEGEVDGGA